MARLQVDRPKVTEYLLDPTKSRGKAVFFARMGFTREDWGILAEALKRQARTGQVVRVAESAHGRRYSVDGILDTPDGRQSRPRVRTVWIEEAGSTVWRLITAHPVKQEP
jgi:hypothetical protein